ncbi:hypothetical protein NliqN6_3392 [Naganishia liquefaciens]|uniref:Potassium transport protein n=1 Tax=Naganishia liquefaciens TaxID=104408 RepID=A0A8H3TTK3_9TREE|nr:hypothetical protein NliqN6_3392 [Naganishia liquefaciens]
MQQQGLRDGFRDMMNMAGVKPSTMQSSTLVESGTGYDETEARMRELNQPFWVKFRKLITGSLNFYRVHMLYFIITPLIISGIFYGANTEYQIDYVDCLFLCVSAMTVTGLATNNLSQLNGYQQSLLFVQMVMGNIITISLVMIMVRQYFFQQEFRHIIEARRQAELEAAQREEAGGGLQSPLKRLRRLSQSLSHPEVQNQDRPQTTGSKLRWTDLFRHSAPPTAENTPRQSLEEARGARSEDSHPSSASSLEKAHRNGQAEILTPKRPPMPDRQHSGSKMGKKKGKGWKGTKLRTDMIQRVEGGGVGLVNPMGWYHSPLEGPPLNATVLPRESYELNETRPAPPPPDSILDNAEGIMDSTQQPPNEYYTASPTELSRTQSPENLSSEPPQDMRRSSEPTNHLAPLSNEEKFPRTKTIAFDDNVDKNRPQRGSIAVAGMTGSSAANRDFMYPSQGRTTGYMPRTGTIRSMNASQGLPVTRTMTRRTAASSSGRILPATSTYDSSGFPRTMTLNQTAKTTGFGGFPTPLALLRTGFETIFPKQSEKLAKTLTMQRTFSNPAGAAPTNPEVKEVGYISFDAVVGRNSHFHDLTKDEHDELGGVEYRALRVLFWIVLLYYICFQVFAFIIVGPYIEAKDYQGVFREQFRYVPEYWFSAFQVVSAFSNTGMSLCDQSMVPFQTAYVMIAVIFVLIFAGNTAFPILLRGIIWIIYRLTPDGSRVRETLQFLLDHPRRCFIYLFPRTQTYFLIFVMVTLTMTDWVCFLVLDIGNPVIEAIPVGKRIAAAFLQSAAVRAAGFGIVPLNSLAPAVKVLYVIMQYISVYPIAMSVRATNVYEEKSLGVFKEGPDEDEEPTDQGPQAITKYLGWHARRQLAFDIWWLAGALWVVCIVERGQLNNEENAPWFSIFNIIFELVSAYGTVGLSLGVAYDNFSLCGAFKPLSKVVIILVMIRGRHRGLPVAIDRAVMLPKDLKVVEERPIGDDPDRLARRATRRSSVIASSTHPGSPRMFDPPTQPSLTHIRSRSNGNETMTPFKLSDPAHDEGDNSARWMSSTGSPERTFSLNKGRKPRSSSNESKHEASISSAFSPTTVESNEQALDTSEGIHPASIPPGGLYSARYNAPGAGIDAQGAPRSLGTLKESALSRHPTMN